MHPYTAIPAASVRDGLIEFLTGIVNGSSTAAGLKSAETAINIMSFSENIDAKFVSLVLSITAPLGFTLMAVYCFGGLANESVRGMGRDDNGVYALVRAVILLVVADYLFLHLKDIAGGIMGLSTVMGVKMKEALATIEPLDTTTVTMDFSGSLLILFTCTVMGILGYLIQSIVSLFFCTICLVTKIAVLLRISFLPFGLASFANPEHQHEGMRYLKKLLASAFYLMGIVVVAFAANITLQGSAIATWQNTGNSLVTQFTSYVSTVLIGGLAAPLAAIGCMSIAKSMIDEAMGA